MGDHTRAPPKKHSIDQMIEHMTADLHNNSDGQYAPLGFTPPPSPATGHPHAWPEYSIPTNSGQMHQQYLHPSMAQENSVYLPELNMHYGLDPSHPNLIQQKHNEMHQNYYYAHQQMLSESRMLDGNLINFGVHANQSSNMNQSYHMLPPDNPQEIHRDITHTHPLGGFIPYHQANVMEQMPQRDYGLFGNNPNEIHAHQVQQQYQPNIANQTKLIENLVGNWVPNQSGTYSPFGCVDTGIKPTTNQQTTQTADIDSDKGIGRVYQRNSKQRMVAEVRPMRPSYSDVLTKSPPPATISTSAKNQTTRNESEKVKSVTVKNANKKNKGSVLKRQHSSGSDEHTNGNGPKIQTPSSTRKMNDNEVKSGERFNSLPRKWVSLDGLDSSDKMALEEEVFQAEEVLRTSGTGSKKQSKKNQHANNWDNVNTLNNHKQSSGSGSKGQSGGGSAKRPIQINNNLGTSQWASAAAGVQASAAGQTGGEKNNLKSGGKNCKSCADDKKANAGVKGGEAKRIGSGRSNSVSSGGPTSEKLGGKRGGGGGGGQRAKRKEYTSPLAVLFRPVRQHLNHWALLAVQACAWFVHLLSDVLGMSMKLSVHLLGFSCDWLAVWFVHCYRKLGSVFVRLRLSDRLGFAPGDGTRKSWWAFWRWGKASKAAPGSPGADGPRFKDGFPPGLESNMALPATGDEAMKRLLACKGKDPYSILGVTPHCTDDDVKKYYKRQAFLVHPDKNNQPGAEEAFKILVHAFELIGEPERRKAYERRVAETQQVEQAWSELSDLLSQLHQKMEYAANTIRCTNCGKRHRRVLVDRPCYAARMCTQCKIMHSAKEGDIWAESSMLGFLWHYYACMDGAVYDITEWAACQADSLKHLRANTHNVQYRIVLGRQQQQSYSRPGGGRAGARGAHDANSEPDLEDFLNNLYSQSGAPGPSGGGANSAAKSDAAPARSRKTSKRKK